MNISSGFNRSLGTISQTICGLVHDWKYKLRLSEILCLCSIKNTFEWFADQRVNFL